jgi:fructose-1,6-bisphosphatase I
MVGDFHRILVQGGVFLYPGSVKKPEGKLRLLYESAPLAFLIEQAGGRASTGTQDILDVVPEKIHQRTPLIIGSKNDVALVESFIQKRAEEQQNEKLMARSRVPQ